MVTNGTTNEFEQLAEGPAEGLPEARSRSRLLRRRYDDRGASLLEMALVTPVFLLVIFAILEFGFMFRSYLAIADAATEAARVGALQGPSPTTDGRTADFSIVSAIRQGTAGLELDEIEAIVVFEGRPSSAGTPMQQVPQACKNATDSIPGLCNVYPADFAFYAVQQGDTAYFRCGGGNTRPCGWNPSSRNNGPKVTEIEYLGVYVRYRHPYMTGMFGDYRNLESASVMRLEPGVVE